MTINIVGEIEVLKKPFGAQFCILNTDKTAINKFYRIADDQLQFLSECGSGWMGTNERNPQAFLSKPIFYKLK